MRSSLVILTSAALLAAWLRPGLARPQSAGFDRGYEEVEAGVEDVDPLAVGLRQLNVDLRQPGFEDVYEVPDQPDLLMRVEGGLFAVFPRSEYGATPFGAVATIPSGTVFHIGAPPPAPTTSAEAFAPRRARIDLRWGRPADVEPAPEPVAVTSTAHADDDDRIEITGALPRTILTDGDYRRRRLRELMLRAAGAGQDRATARSDETTVAARERAAPASSAHGAQAARGRSSSSSSK